MLIEFKDEDIVRNSLVSKIVSQYENFEKILSDQEFGILVLTVLNNFKSEVILNDILDIIENAIKKNKYNHG